MKVSFYQISLVSVLAASCLLSSTTLYSQAHMENSLNMTRELVSGMNWMNPPQVYEVEKSVLNITVEKGTDFFNNPEDGTITGSAPFLYKEVAGDFVAKALVQPDFSAQWNAVALMLHIDGQNWIKFAFENSDATGPGIVTVVTKGTSDDANGVVLNGEKMIWLALVRKGNIYSMHWSVDGENFKMARLTSMKDQNTVNIGIEVQSPVGEHATHRVHHFEIEAKTVEDLRNINGK